mgnify:FL=1
MKILLSFLLTVMFISPSTNLNNEIENLNLSSENYILYSVNAEQVIASKNEDLLIEAASLNKVLTLITAIDLLGDENLYKTLVIEPEIFEDISPLASLAGLQIDESYKLIDILYGISLPSGADATRAISHYLTGNVEGLANEMNKKAKEIGMTNTKIINTSGLDAEGQYTTLTDLLTLINYARKNDLFMNIFQSIYYEFQSKDGVNMEFNNFILKESLERDFPYMVGAKSGYTDNAKFSLMSIAKKDNIEYIFISHRAEIDFDSIPSLEDAIKVYEYLFENYKSTKLNRDDLILDTKIRRRIKNYQFDYNQTEAIVPIDFDESFLEVRYNLKQEPIAPVKKGTVIGTQFVYYDGELIKTNDIKFEENVEQSFIFIIFSLFKWIGIIILVLAFLVLAIRTYNIQRHKSKYRRK